MDNHGTIMIGAFVNQKISTLPEWTADDEGRMIYVEDVDTLYYGTNAGWSTGGFSTSDMKKFNLI